MSGVSGIGGGVRDFDSIMLEVTEGAEKDGNESVKSAIDGFKNFTAQRDALKVKRDAHESSIDGHQGRLDTHNDNVTFFDKYTPFTRHKEKGEAIQAEIKTEQARVEKVDVELEVVRNNMDETVKLGSDQFQSANGIMKSLESLSKDSASLMAKLID